jgi:hypothetical protein
MTNRMYRFGYDCALGHATGKVSAAVGFVHELKLDGYRPYSAEARSRAYSHAEKVLMSPPA